MRCLLCLLAVMTAAACAGVKGDPTILTFDAPWGGKVKKHQAGALSISYPADWHIMTHKLKGQQKIGDHSMTIPKSMRVSVFAPEPGDQGLAVSVLIEPVSYEPAGSFKKLHELLSGGIRKYSEVIVHVDKKLTARGLPAVDIVYQWKNRPGQDGWYVNWTRYIRISPAKAYYISYSCSAKDFKKFLPQAAAVIDSIKIAFDLYFDGEPVMPAK